MYASSNKENKTEFKYYRTVLTYSCVWYREITPSNMRAMSVRRWHCTSKIIFCSAVKSLHCMLENGVDLDLS